MCFRLHCTVHTPQPTICTFCTFKLKLPSSEQHQPLHMMQTNVLKCGCYTWSLPLCKFPIKLLQTTFFQLRANFVLQKQILAQLTFCDVFCHSRNVNTFITRSKTFKSNFTRRKTRKSRQFWH